MKIEDYGRIINLWGEVTPEMSLYVVTRLQELNAKNHDPITIQIHSPGGSLRDGMIIIDMMEAIQSPVYTMALGNAMSMASLILAAGEKGHRKALKHSTIMIHQGSTICEGKFSDIKSGAKRMVETEEMIEELYVKYTGKTKRKIHADLQMDLFLSSDKAVEYGLIDEVVEQEEKFNMEKSQPKYGEYVYKYMFEHDEQGN